MPIPALLGAGIVIKGLSSVAQGILGIEQNEEAKRLAQTPFVPYEIEQEYYNNQGLAQNMAQYGLTQGSKDFYQGQADRGLTASIDAATRGGGGINSFANLYDTYLQNNMKIASEDSQLQTQNIRYLIDRNVDLAGQKTQQWAINDYSRWKDAMQASAAAKTSSTNNLFGAATGFASTLATAASAKSYDKLANPEVAGTLSTVGNLASIAAPQIVPSISSSPPTMVGQGFASSTGDPNVTQLADEPSYNIDEALNRLIKKRFIKI